MTKATRLLTLLILGASVAAPAHAQDQMIIGQIQFIANLHPAIQVNNTKRGVIGYAQRPITAFDEKGENVCILCETVPTVENGLVKIVDRPNGQKGMDVTLKLKAGLKWGDGVPVTAKDIAFTWKIGTDPAIGFSNYNPWNRATGVDVVDDRTAVMHLPSVMTGFNSWDQIIPEHLEGPVYAENKTGEAYLKQTGYNRAPTTPGLWNGPFLFSSYQPGTRVVMEKNPHFQPAPKLDRIILAYRDNSSALMQNFIAGAIDAVPVSPGGISFAQFLELKKSYPDRFQYFVEPGDNLERIAMQLENPILADVRVRRALLHAIDRKTISDRLFDGLQPVADGPLPKGTPYYNAAMAVYPYDVARAKALLAEAGWKPGADGICVNGAGERLSLEFVTTAGNQTRQQITQVLQNQFKLACIEIQPKLVALQEYNGVMLRRRAFKGLLMGSIDFPPSASPRIVLGSDRIPAEANAWAGNNFSGYKNTAMDALMERVETAVSEVDAKAVWGEIQKIYAEDLPLLPLYFYARAYVAQKNVFDFVPTTVDPLNIWSEKWRRR